MSNFVPKLNNKHKANKKPQAQLIPKSIRKIGF